MRLLVCVDLSPLTDRVVAEAIALARACDASNVLLHVVRTEPALVSGGVRPPGGHRVPPDDLEEARARVRGLADRFRAEELEVHAEVRLTDGEIAAAVLDEIDRHQASYVVIGSHGHTTLFEALVGSVTRGVMRGARVPLVVVPDPRATIRR